MHALHLRKLASEPGKNDSYDDSQYGLMHFYVKAETASDEGFEKVEENTKGRQIGALLLSVAYFAIGLCTTINILT